ncbi:MAG: M6 family metalloprotease domain-containing protein [bacterium]
MKFVWNSKRVWLTVAMAALAGVQLFAAPFDRVWKVKQPDGTVIQIHGKGDDFSADMEVGGYTILFDSATSFYVYAQRTADGRLVPSPLVAGRDAPATLNLQQHLRPDVAVQKQMRQERFNRWDEVTQNSARWKARKERTAKLLSPSPVATASPADGPALSPPGNPTTGNKAGLCLLVDFSDDPATVSQNTIDDFCNGDNFTGYGNNGSVKKYFQDVSNNRLTYTNIVTVYLRVPHPKTYYNTLSPSFGVAANLLVKDALDVLRALPNYATEIGPQLQQALTVDGSGNAVACSVFYAGGADIGWSQGLWPHSWGLYNVGRQSLGGGVYIFNYQMTDIGDSLTLGTFCHENGHMLCGFPDIYDYDYDSAGGAGNFCIMDYGGGGGNPTKPCGYLRMHAGWLDLVNIETVPDYVLTLTTADTTIYKYTKPTVSTEYYLFENRQRSGRDANIPGSGIAIWHCDELGNRDNQLYAYNTGHQNYEVQLMQADNQWHLNKNQGGGEQADLYYYGNPSAVYRNEFSDLSAPSARWWDGSLSSLFAGSFSVSGASMTMSLIKPAPEIANQSPLPDGRVGNPYWLQFSTTDNYASNTWSVLDAAALPAGLTLVPSGFLSGVPTLAGTNSFVIVVKGRSPITTTNTFEIVILPAYTAPFFEGFNGAMEGPLTGWHQESVSNNLLWRTCIRAPSGRPSQPYEGEQNAYLGVFNDNGTAALPYHITRLISPMIKFGPTARGARISFAYYLENRITYLRDSLSVYYKTSWSDNWTGPLATFNATDPVWQQQSFTLPESAAGKGFYFAFVGSALGGYGISLDAIQIDDPVPPLRIITPTPLPIALCETNYTLAIPLVTLQSEGCIIDDQTNYQYTVVNGTALPSGFRLTPTGVITGKWNTVIALIPFDVEVTDLISGAKATNTLGFAVEYPRVPVLQENFSTNTSKLPSGWTTEYVANTVDWRTCYAGGKDGRSPPSAAQSGYQYAFFFGTPGVGAYTCSKLVSPVFDLTQMPNNSRLVFWHFMQFWGGQDQLRVYYRNVLGAPWTLLETYTNNVASWTQRIIPLPLASSTYQIAFEGFARSGYGVCVDNVSITDDGGAPVILTRDVLPSGFDNFSYETRLEAVGSITPYRWTVVSNGLPRGLVLNLDTGIISGIPVGATQTTFRVAVTGYDNRASTNIFSLKILPPGIVPYFESFTETTLPTGWNQVTTYGAVAWKTTVGTYSTYSMADATRAPLSPFSTNYNVCLWGSLGAYQVADLITKPFDLAGCTNTTVSFQLCMKRYNNYQDWLSVYYRSHEEGTWKLLAAYDTAYFSSTNAILFSSWTQQTFQLPEPSATYRLKFEGSTRGGWGICIDDVDVRGYKDVPPLVITTSPVLPEGTNLVLYPNVTLAATGGTIPSNYTWRVVASDIFPPGLTLNLNTGVISGTPTQYGLYTFGVTVQDENNVVTTGEFTLRIQRGTMAPFDTWKATYFPLPFSYSGDAIDQSGDGIPNLIKYGMGLNPTNRNTGVYILGGLTNLIDGRYLYLGYRRSLTATDLDFFVKGTTNLADAAGSWLTNNIVEHSPWIVGETDVWSWVYNVHTTPVTNAPQRFLRLGVELKP